MFFIFYGSFSKEKEPWGGQQLLHSVDPADPYLVRTGLRHASRMRILCGMADGSATGFEPTLRTGITAGNWR